MSFAADFLGYVGLAVMTLLPIINPVGTAVLLLGIGAHLEPAVRERQIRKACVYASGILIAFLLLGTIYAGAVLSALWARTLASAPQQVPQSPATS